MGGPVFINDRYIDELDTWYTFYLIDKDGTEYPSVEHYYQSKKCINEEEKKQIIQAKSAREAFQLGRECLLRSDWIEIRNQIMFEGNLLKIEQYPKLKDILIQSEGDIIYPGNDLYWSGDIFRKGKGKNTFGIILMTIRALMKKETEIFIELCKVLDINPEKYL